MEETNNELNENPVFTDQELFTGIWSSPRAAFKFINEQKYDNYVTILLVLAGISRAFDRAEWRGVGDQIPLMAVIVSCIIGGALFGWISYYIYAALVSFTGDWLGGKGNTTSILRVMAYAMIPSVIALFFLIPQVLIYGNEVFKKDGDTFNAGMFGNIIFYTSVAIELILGAWTIFLLVIGISEVQKLSIGKAILNIVLPALLIVVPLVFIIFLVKS